VPTTPQQLTAALPTTPQELTAAVTTPVAPLPLHPPMVAGPVTTGSHVPPTVLAAPVAPMRSRRGLLVAIVSLLVLALGALGVWFLVPVLGRSPGRKRTAVPKGRANTPRKAHATLARFRVRKLSAQQVLNRLADDGWDITHELPSETDKLTSVNYVVLNGSVAGSIMFHSFKTATDAQFAEQMWRGHYGGVVRDEEHVLVMALGDQALSADVLAHLLR
jgi:hypothetical protein